MKRILLLISLISLTSFTFSQTPIDSQAKEDFISQITEVQTAKYTYTQSLTYISDYIFNIAITQTSLKGKSKSSSFEFSMTDIDKNTVSISTQKDKILVNIKTIASKKYIKVLSESGALSYTSGFSIIAENNNNARDIKESFVSMIPLSKEFTEQRLQASSYEELQQWLQENTVDVTAGNTQFEQSLETTDDYVAVVSFKQKEITEKKQIDKTFEFNLADINKNNISYIIKGSKFAIKLETKLNLLHIRAANNETQLPYAKTILIYVKDSESAYDLKNALEKIIPLAEELLEASLPKTEDLGELLSLFKSHINNVNNPSINIEQEVNEDILCELKTITQTPKAVINNTYSLFLGELDNNTVKVKISKTKIMVSAVIKGKKPHIKVSENDLMQNYSSNIDFYCSDIETSRHLKHILKQLIPIAKKNYKTLIPQGDANTKLEWALKQVTDINDPEYSYVQSLELLEDDIIKYRLEKSSPKKTVEIIYEFNYNDIDTKQLNLEIKGKNIFVNFNTKAKAKLINHYENAEVKPYVYSFKIRFEDYEIAQNFVQAMTDVINDQDGE